MAYASVPCSGPRPRARSALAAALVRSAAHLPIRGRCACACCWLVLMERGCVRGGEGRCPGTAVLYAAQHSEGRQCHAPMALYAMASRAKRARHDVSKRLSWLLLRGTKAPRRVYLAWASPAQIGLVVSLQMCHACCSKRCHAPRLKEFTYTRREGPDGTTALAWLRNLCAPHAHRAYSALGNEHGAPSCAQGMQTYIIHDSHLHPGILACTHTYTHTHTMHVQVAAEQGPSD